MNPSNTVSAPIDLFAFQWQRAAAGYELQVPKSTAKVLAQGARIVRRGGHVETYPPRAFPDMHRRFAAIESTPEGALAFVREFGFLGLPDGTGEAESVTEILAAAQHMREALDVFDTLVRAEARGKKAVAEMKEGGAALVQGVDPGDFRVLAGGLFNRWAAPGIAARLAPARTSRGGLGLALTFAPATLLASLWLQAAEELTEGARFTHCEWCHKPIAIGRSGGRSDKRTCSDVCRQALSKHNRKAKAAAAAKPTKKARAK